MRALTPEEIRSNEKLAEEIKSKPWLTPDSQNPHQPWTIQAKDLKDRL
jgi:hypothetical protein